MRDEVNRLLGLEGFVVRAVGEQGGVLEIEVELALAAAVCPHCGRGSIEVKERPLVLVRDLPIAGRWVWLRWRKRRFACQACARTFTETHVGIPSRQRMTSRFRRHLFALARGGGAQAEIARQEGVSRYQVERAFAEGAAGLLAALPRARPRRLAFDEAAHRRGRGSLATVVSDLDRRRVFDVVDGRDQGTIERYLRSLPEHTRRSIEVVSIDPYEGYRRAVRAQLPGVRIVCDPFHLVRGAGQALDRVRRERQRRPGARPRVGARRAGGTHFDRSLYHARRRLLKGRERLSEVERAKLCELFAHEPLIAEAWGLKEAFRAIYQAADRGEAERRLERFLAACERAAIPSFTAFAHGVRQWRAELLAYFDKPTSNGYAEGVTNKIKVIKRRAYGLPTFEGFRRRVLVACA
jgi:transposase